MLKVFFQMSSQCVFPLVPLRSNAGIFTANDVAKYFDELAQLSGKFAQFSSEVDQILSRYSIIHRINHSVKSSKNEGMAAFDREILMLATAANARSSPGSHKWA